MQPVLLPLFPLPLVIFPRTRQPLHIFEDRYKELVSQSLEGRTEFGIVLAKDDGILNVGCTVLVDRTLKEYPDGRLDIVVLGIRRFEITSVNQDKPYLRGEVSFFDDDDDEVPASREAQFRALEQYRSWLELDETKPFGDALLTDPQLSFQIAQGIQDVEFLQVLLRSRSEADRLQQVTEYLARYVPQQQQSARMKRVAPLNGHGAHPPGL